MALGTGPLTTTDTPTQTRRRGNSRNRSGSASRTVRTWMALPRTEQYLSRRSAPPDRGIRHQPCRLRRQQGRHQDSRRILPPHGGNLAHGTVKGDSIACPFHDWRWGGNGKCTAIPYARRVPPLAKTRAWITLEKNGQLFVWHDPQGNPPPAEVTIPDIEGFGSDEWSDWSWNTLTIEGSHCREIVDNVVDMAHFFYVHYSFPKYFKNIFEGHVASQYMESVGREDVISGTNYGDPNAVLRSDASYFGPSYMIDWIKSEANGQIIETVLINCHYPISNNAFVLQYGAMVKKLPGMDDEATAAMAAQFTEGVEMGFLQDVEIWKNKAPIDNPLLSEEDGPVYQLRRWYNQFYTDVENVTEDMTKRFEFEIDTTRAVESWKREVAENVAARDAQALETTS